MVDAASALGYPEAPSGDKHKRAFDQAAGVLLHEHLPMTPNEAACEDVWNYLTGAWLIDLCAWRWGWDAQEVRFTGHADRGQFRRVWWREAILGSSQGGKALGAYLGEEELVQVMERPTLTRHRIVARDLVVRYLIARGRLNDFRDVGLGRQDVMRGYSQRVLRLAPFIALESLNREQRGELFTEVLRDTINSLVPPADAVATADLVVGGALEGEEVDEGR